MTVVETTADIVRNNSKPISRVNDKSDWECCNNNLEIYITQNEIKLQIRFAYRIKNFT